MNNTVSFEPEHKNTDFTRPRINRKLKPKKKSSIVIIEDDGLFHCNIVVNTEDVVDYKMGAIRHSHNDIRDYAVEQTTIQNARGAGLPVLFI